MGGSLFFLIFKVNLFWLTIDLENQNGYKTG